MVSGAESLTSLAKTVVVGVVVSRRLAEDVVKSVSRVSGEDMAVAPVAFLPGGLHHRPASIEIWVDVSHFLFIIADKSPIRVCFFKVEASP